MNKRQRSCTVSETDLKSLLFSFLFLSSLAMIEQLREKAAKQEEMETQFLLSDQAYAKAKIPPTDKVCLWLGANVMLEYSLDDAEDLLTKNKELAEKTILQTAYDLVSLTF